MTPTAVSADLADSNAAVSSDASCKPLPPGHMRRVFYGVPTTNPDAFGLAYEEVDEHGKVVGPAATDLLPSNPMNPTVCMPLGPGNTPTVERWQLVNVATEDHNFHIHQVKFRVVAKDELAGTVVPKQVLGTGVMLDNVPLASASGTCGNNPPDDLHRFSNELTPTLLPSRDHEGVIACDGFSSNANRSKQSNCRLAHRTVQIGSDYR